MAPKVQGIQYLGAYDSVTLLMVKDGPPGSGDYGSITVSVASNLTNAQKVTAIKAACNDFLAKRATAEAQKGPLETALATVAVP